MTSATPRFSLLAFLLLGSLPLKTDVFEGLVARSYVPHPTEKDQVVLNVKSRFFTEDIPYGLCVLKGIGELAGVQTPNIDKTIQWHQKFMDDDYVDEKGNFLPGAIEKTGAP